jgi:DNA processing protein
VWAVPGRIFDERSLGTHALIRDGAALVEHPRDILEAIDPSGRHRMSAGAAAAAAGPPAAELPQPPPGLTAEIHAALVPGSFEVAEDLAGRLAVTVDRVLGALLELEVGGWIRRLPGPVYGR